MSDPKLSVRELQQSDIPFISDYWLQAGKEYLQGMGVDITKMPVREQWVQMLTEQIQTPIDKKQSYCMIWLLNDKPVGHSNVNKIVFGKEAYMHLHLWQAEVRKQGHGSAFIKLTLPHFFENLQLEQLFCEPYALNPAPNKILERIGFDFVKAYTTTPGWINFEQEVKLWLMTRDRYKEVILQR